MSENFKMLSDADHILLRPSMYIGSVALEKEHRMIAGEYKQVQLVPGLLKIIDEIIDNSVDEFIRTDGVFANKIDIEVKNWESALPPYSSIRISDNGRGIPVVKHGKDDNSYQAVLAWTQARAGSNFGEDRVTIGANGVGSFCTNVFSSEFIGESCDGSQKLKMVCENNGKIKSVKISNSPKRGTSVTFNPELFRFGLDKITDDHFTVIKDRLENLMICHPGITFSFNGEKLKFRNTKEFTSRFKDCIQYQDANNLLVIAPSGEDEEFRLVSYVNGLNIKNGGIHVYLILYGISNNLITSIKKKHKIDVLPNQIKSHLLLAVYSRSFNNLKFDSQTKEKMTNTWAEIKVHYENFNFEKITKDILNTPAIIDPMINALLFKRDQAERLALARAQKNIKNVRVINHIAAQSKNPDEKTLFIAEGLSAIGQILNVRNPKFVGGYPLRGKVMNVRGMKPADIVKNKEISELMSILGLQFGDDGSSPNYGKIVILTDADTDGASIACLLLNLFSYWKGLFSNGHVYMCQTPLYICTKGKVVKSFYTKEDFDKFDSKGYTVDYIKGLGSLPKEVYKEVINEPRLVKITAKEVADYGILEMAFGDSADSRKEWMME